MAIKKANLFKAFRKQEHIYYIQINELELYKYSLRQQKEIEYLEGRNAVREQAMKLVKGGYDHLGYFERKKINEDFVEWNELEKEQVVSRLAESLSDGMKAEYPKTFRITYEEPESGEMKRTGVRALNEDEAVEKFQERKLGVIRNITSNQ